MARNILAVVGALAIVVIIGGAAYKSFAPSPVPAFQQVGAKSISQIPITQHFCQHLGSLGTVGSPQGYSVQLPASVGLAISQITINAAPGNTGFIVRTSGIERFRATGSGTTNAYYIPIEPPLIARPGEVVEVGTNGNTVGITLSGYYLTAADFGQ